MRVLCILPASLDACDGASCYALEKWFLSWQHGIVCEGIAYVA